MRKVSWSGSGGGRGMNELASASGSLVAPQPVSVAIDLVSQCLHHQPPSFLLLPDLPPAFACCQPIDVMPLNRSGALTLSCIDQFH